MRLNRLGTIVVALGLVAWACGGKDATGVSVPVNGEWAGTTSQANGQFGFDMTVTEDSTGHVSGTGWATGFGGAGGSIAYAVDGTRSGSRVTLTFNSSGFYPPTFTATLTDASTLDGHLSDSGFNNAPLTLHRI